LGEVGLARPGFREIVMAITDLLATIATLNCHSPGAASPSRA
jgi:hypothetical protein